MATEKKKKTLLPLNDYQNKKAALNRAHTRLGQRRRNSCGGTRSVPTAAPRLYLVAQTFPTPTKRWFYSVWEPPIAQSLLLLVPVIICGNEVYGMVRMNLPRGGGRGKRVEDRR